MQWFIEHGIQVWSVREGQQKLENHTLKLNDVPLNTKAQALLAGKVYCGQCGSKLVLTTSGRTIQQDGVSIKATRTRYGCHFKTRHPDGCDGQAGYSVAKLDKTIDKMVLDYLNRFQSSPEKKLINRQHQNMMEEMRAALTQTERD